MPDFATLSSISSPTFISGHGMSATLESNNGGESMFLRARFTMDLPGAFLRRYRLNQTRGSAESHRKSAW